MPLHVAMLKENLDRRMIPYGINLNTIPMEEPECKAIIPINEPTPLATIPPKPCSYGSSYYVQPVSLHHLSLSSCKELR
jgi:hypothetical protein